MNKSLLTNTITVLIIITSFVTPIYSEQLRAIGLYAFSGAVTNWLAIHMLFEKVPFLYGSGVITQRFEQFKLGIKELVMSQFFTKENISKFLSGGESGLNIDSELVFVKLKEAVLESPFGNMLGMFGGEAALEPLRPKVHEKMIEILNESSPNTDNSLFDQVSHIVDRRLDELTPQMVKDIIQKMIREHLGWLVVWGGVFGGLIGFITTFL